MSKRCSADAINPMVGRLPERAPSPPPSGSSNHPESAQRQGPLHSHRPVAERNEHSFRGERRHVNSRRPADAVKVGPNVACDVGRCGAASSQQSVGQLPGKCSRLRSWRGLRSACGYLESTRLLGPQRQPVAPLATRVSLTARLIHSMRPLHRRSAQAIMASALTPNPLRTCHRMRPAEHADLARERGTARVTQSNRHRTVGVPS